MSHQRRVEQTSKYTDTHPLSPSTFDPVLDLLLLLAPTPLISLPASLYTSSLVCLAYCSSHLHRSAAEQREIGRGQPQSTVPYLPAAVKKPTLPIPSFANRPSRVDPNPIQPGPIHGYI